MKEADAALEEAAKKFPDNVSVQIAKAKAAHEQGNYLLALRQWDAIETSHPGLVDGYLGASDALCRLGRYEDAENILLPAMRRFPESFGVASRYAWIAHYQRNWERAIERWADVRNRFADVPGAYSATIATLREAGRFADADAFASVAKDRFPADFWIDLEWARVPVARQDSDAAAARLSSVRQRHPNNPHVYAAVASALGTARNSDAADAELEAGFARIGKTSALQAVHARNAMLARDWPEAERRWRGFLTDFPDLPAGPIGLAETLRNAGRIDESDGVLADLTGRLPNNMEVERQQALNATWRRDWPDALGRWAELKRRYPAHGGVQAGIVDAMWQARQDLLVANSGETTSVPFEIPAILTESLDAPQPDAAEMTKLFMGFESLGDTCEFGIVQRRFGAEPISLLRWASIAPSKLVEALDARFAGVGDPEHTLVQVSHGEYTTRDTRYHMFSHTFTPEAAAPIEKFTVQQCRRLRFLRNKLLEDLSSGIKIFVYKSNSDLSVDDALAIHAAIRRYGGSSALLCVRLTQSTHSLGSLDCLADGLYMGHSDRFSTVDINVDNWVRLCQAAQKKWDEARGTNVTRDNETAKSALGI